MPNPVTMSTVTLAPTTQQPTSKTAAGLGGGDKAKHAMTSTWPSKAQDQRTASERLLAMMGLASYSSLKTPAPIEPPVYPKDAPVPVFPLWKMYLFVSPRVAAPLLAHAAFEHFTGITINRAAAMALYSISLIFIGISFVRWCNRTALQFGTFDAQAGRDGVPDVDTWHVVRELLFIAISRPLVGVYFLYRPGEPLLSLKSLVMFPLNMFIYAVILDFYFYWYHRLMHEVGFLWRFHRKHHTTKHPNAALSAFADHEQELFDALIIPALTWLTWRIDFATWFGTTVYILYVEAFGHSGIRAYFQIPTTWPLRFLGCELCIEDHDLHHRQGWKKSGNYGKQTRLWDAIFGTCKPRIESTQQNIDWNLSTPPPLPKHST